MSNEDEEEATLTVKLLCMHNGDFRSITARIIVCIGGRGERAPQQDDPFGEDKIGIWVVKSVHITYDPTIGTIQLGYEMLTSRGNAFPRSTDITLGLEPKGSKYRKGFRTRMNGGGDWLSQAIGGFGAGGIGPSPQRVHRYESIDDGSTNATANTTSSGDDEMV